MFWLGSARHQENQQYPKILTPEVEGLSPEMQQVYANLRELYKAEIDALKHQTWKQPNDSDFVTAAKDVYKAVSWKGVRTVFSSVKPEALQKLLKHVMKNVRNDIATKSIEDNVDMFQMQVWASLQKNENSRQIAWI